MAHAAHDLVVDSVTGVDVSMAVAGTGARALAFLIDLIIRGLLMGAWYILATLLYNGRWSLQAPFDPDASWLLLVAMPPTLIYGLYHVVLEIAMRGRTPGKRMVGVRIVTRNGAVPSAASFIVRNVFRLVDSFPLFYGVGLVTSLVTREHVRVGDLAAGTLLVYENRSALDAELPLGVGRGQMDLATTELVGELLSRWKTLAADVRDRLARSLLARVPGARVDDASSDDALRNELERVAGIAREGERSEAGSAGRARDAGDTEIGRSGIDGSGSPSRPASGGGEAR